LQAILTGLTKQWCEAGYIEPLIENNSPRGWFTLTMPLQELKAMAGAGSEKGSEKIMRLMAEKPSISAEEIAGITGVSSRAVEKQIATLRKKDKIRRIGPAKGGHWEVTG
jgi:ATP-dependent DNA helicase RecG